MVYSGTTEQDPDEILRRAAGIPGRKGASVRLLDSRLVFGEDHIRSAFQKAVRAFETGNNVSDSIATETMLYMSGRRQIQEAVDLIGVKKDSRLVVCIAEMESDIEKELVEALSLAEGEVMSPGETGLALFGITREELATLPKERRTDLVLERVASVDVKKK